MKFLTHFCFRSQWEANGFDLMVFMRITMYFTEQENVYVVCVTDWPLLCGICCALNSVFHRYEWCIVGESVLCVLFFILQYFVHYYCALSAHFNLCVQYFQQIFHNTLLSIVSRYLCVSLKFSVFSLCFLLAGVLIILIWKCTINVWDLFIYTVFRCYYLSH